MCVCGGGGGGGDLGGGGGRGCARVAHHTHFMIQGPLTGRRGFPRRRLFNLHEVGATSPPTACGEGGALRSTRVIRVSDGHIISDR